MTYHGSGKTYEEGWVIKVSKNNSYKSFDPSTDFDCITSMIQFVGDHKFYYKTGALSTKISYPKSLKDTVVMTIYSKKGDVVAIDKFLERPVITIDCDPKEKYGIVLFDYYHFTNIKKGIIRSEGFYKEHYVKTGCWRKYNKKGDLKKSILHEDDKKLKKFCW